MKKPFLTLALALSASASLAGLAQAADQTAAAPSTQVSAPAPSTQVEQEALDAFRHNINPNAIVPSTGIYDDSDRFTGPTGTPLPGWGSVNGEGAGDNNG
jgi:hypothetical protein